MPSFRIVLGAMLLYFTAGTTSANATGLDDYIAQPDPNYTYTHYHTEESVLATTYFLLLTSQQWRSAAEVDRPLWQHEVKISVPRSLIFDPNSTAIMVISGGSNRNDPSTDISTALELVISLLGAVAIEVKQIPNQPLTFADEPGQERKEDEILAYSMDKFLTTGDAEWPVHVAMTKAAVRAMDAVQEFLANEDVDIDDFIVLGGSKRGWASWLTAAVDSRVRAIVPASIDMLNLDRQFMHHWEAYGFFTAAVQDYIAFDLQCRVQTPGGQALLDIIDPYSYRERYVGLPKLILNASGDQFFVSDSSRFYFDELPTPKLMRYSTNTDHSQDEDVLIAGLSWIDDILSDRVREPFTWRFEADGSIRVETSAAPDKVKLWQATNPSARDFRLEVIGPAWTSETLNAISDGVYVARVEPPPAGWTAFLIELTYQDGGPLKPDQVYTSGVRVTPDVLPFAGTFCHDWTRLLNSSSRGLVGNGEATQRAGFIVTGSERKRFLVKGEGAILGLPNTILDPYLRLYDLNSGATIDENDNWREHATAAEVAAFAPPLSDLEAAFVVDLPAGAYVAELTDKENSGGLGLVAVTEYEQDTLEPTLLNVSNRGPVETGEATLRTGFIVTGASKRRFLVKGEGAILGLPDAIRDPALRLYNLHSGETIEFNDNWRDHSTAAEVAAFAPPSNDLEAAFVVELVAGAYIAELTDNDNSGGIGIVAVTEYPE